MANENGGTVSEVEATPGVADVEAPSGQEGAGAATPAVDMQQYERIQQEHGQLTNQWNRIEQLANSDPQFRKELERAWRGIPSQPVAQPKPEAQPRKEKNVEDDRLKSLQDRLEKFEGYQQQQQQEAMRKEKFAEVQSETDATFKKFGADENDQKEFWNRYGNMIRTEAMGSMQNNPSLPPNMAMQMAYSRHSANIAGEYALLMEDKLVPFYANKLQERNNPLRGIATPADKAGKGGSWPTTQERFINAIKNEKDSTKRAEMYSAYAKEMGVPVGDLFRSTGG